MIEKPECISDDLLLLARQMNALFEEHGVINMDQKTSVSVIILVSRIADLARRLENAWSQAEWNRRASEDRVKLLCDMNRISADVLDLMRPGTLENGNVLPFPSRPSHPSHPSPSTPPGSGTA